MPPGPFSVNWFYFKKPSPPPQSDREEEVAGERKRVIENGLSKKEKGEIGFVRERVKGKMAVTKRGSAQAAVVAH